MTGRAFVVISAVLMALGLFVPAGSISASAVSTAISGSGYVALSHDVPTIVTNGRARVLGPLPADTRLRIVMVLKIRDWAALNNAILSASSPNSPSYGHYVTQDQANNLFNPTLAQQDAVAGWLRSQGVTVTQTFANHLLVGATGPITKIEAALHVTIQQYSGPIGGAADARFYSPSTNPSIPADLAGSVLTVLGLDDATRAFSDAIVGPRVGLKAGANEYTHPGQFYFPTDYRAAYDVPSADIGTGQHIGITLWDAAPSDATLAAWGCDVSGTPVTSGQTCTNPYPSPSRTSGSLVVDAAAGASTTDSGESAMDIEESFGMAPGATIDYYEAASSSDADLSTQLNAAGTTSGATMDRQISNSWGLCEAPGGTDGNLAEDSVLASDTATGHDFLFATGDTGSYCAEGMGVFDDPYPHYPASSPYVTAVGGTGFGNGDCTTAPPDTITSYPGEQSWCYNATGNTSSQCGSGDGNSNPCPLGSSGGYSDAENRPSWQLELGSYDPTAGGCVNDSGCRGFPDVAAAADPHFAGALVATDEAASDPNGIANDIGGTSLASPLWAGMMADMNGYLAGRTTPQSLGFANPTFYFIAAGNFGNYANDFHDINPSCPTGNNAGCTNGAYSTSANWDPVTGIGSPDVAQLQADIPFPVVTINIGWNLIDIPVDANSNSPAISSASTLIANMAAHGVTGGTIQAVATFARGRFSLYVPGYAATLPISATQGIFVLSGATSPQAWSPGGTTPTTAPTISLKAGWNLVGTAFPTTGLTGQQLNAQLGGTGAPGCGLQEVATYAGSYSIYTPSHGPSAFQVSPTAGMWILCTQAYPNWQP